MNLVPSRERAALVREEDVDEEEEAAGPRTADLHRDCRPGIRVKHRKLLMAGISITQKSKYLIHTLVTNEE